MSRWIVFAAALLMPALAAAQVNAIPSAPHLLVKGHAEGHYVPDRFTVSLHVEETDMVPDLARKKVEAHMAQIFAALDSAGALPGKTSASSLQIEPKSEYRDDRNVFIGTQVSRSAHATFDDLDKLRAFIGQLKAARRCRSPAWTWSAAMPMRCSSICASARWPIRRRRRSRSRRPMA